jgi:hypothetical protein
MVIGLVRTIPSTILDAIRRLDEVLAQGSVEVAREAALESRVRRRMWGGLTGAQSLAGSTNANRDPDANGRLSRADLFGDRINIPGEEVAEALANHH